MTAASPWETLWRFSPSSKLPMSAEGRAHMGSGVGEVTEAGHSWGGSGDSGGEMPAG